MFKVTICDFERMRENDGKIKIRSWLFKNTVCVKGDYDISCIRPDIYHKLLAIRMETC